MDNFDINQILRSIFKVYSLALENDFTVNHVNIIESTNGLICSEAGTGLEISESQDLQKLGNLARNYLLQLEWVDGRLLVFSNALSSALLLNENETASLLKNYGITQYNPLAPCKECASSLKKQKN